MGWLFTRWTLPEIENRPRERVRVVLPIAFAVLLAVYGAYNWAIAWLTLDQAWVVGVAWILLTLPAALPEYDKRREHERAVRPPGSSDAAQKHLQED
jgi:hypothetical protein